MIKGKWTTSFSTTLLGLIFISRLAVAAPCCSSNAAAPSLISGDDRAQVTLLLGQSHVIGDAPAEGIAVFRAPDDYEITQTARLDGAFLFSDRWQVGGTLPLVRRSVERSGFAAQGVSVGDVRLNFAYEFLPEWTYSVWRPKGYVFLQTTFPTARSIYELDGSSRIGAFGQGFFTFAVGCLLQKRWASWDVYFIPELHQSLARDFTDPSSGGTLRVTPSLGANAALGGGYSPGRFRFGARIQPIYNGRKSIEDNRGLFRGAYQLVWDVGADLSYLIADEWSLQASYTDQTLLGPAVGGTLSRTFTASVQYRLPR